MAISDGQKTKLETPSFLDGELLVNGWRWEENVVKPEQGINIQVQKFAHLNLNNQTSHHMLSIDNGDPVFMFIQQCTA